MMEIRNIDYKPLGDSLGSEQERLGFIDNEFDFESRYFPMGAGMYDVNMGWLLYKLSSRI